MANNEAEKVLFLSNGPEETRELGRAFGKMCRGGEVILLTGQMGAGKTTLVQGIARGLGVVGPVQSPSFVLERIHKGRLTLRHLDLYRLSAPEVDDAGLLTDITDDDVTVIEWGDRAAVGLEADLAIDIQPHNSDADKRSIWIEAWSSGWQSNLLGVKHR